jgi:hypothetical protein
MEKDQFRADVEREMRAILERRRQQQEEEAKALAKEQNDQ